MEEKMHFMSETVVDTTDSTKEISLFTKKMRCVPFSTTLLESKST